MKGTMALELQVALAFYVPRHSPVAPFASFVCAPWRFRIGTTAHPPDKSFALRYASIIHAALTRQARCYSVPFGFIYRLEL